MFTVLQYGLLGDPSLISLTVSVDVKHYVYCLAVRAEEGDMVWVGVGKPHPTSVGWVWLLLSVSWPVCCLAGRAKEGGYGVGGCWGATPPRQ